MAVLSRRRPRVPILGFAIAASSLAAIAAWSLTACSDDGPPSSGDDAGVAETSTGPSEDASSAEDSDAPVPESDAAAEAGDPSDPSVVTCGDAGCALPGQQCCVTATDRTCQPAGGECQGGRQSCDERADCEGDRLCCIRLDPDKPEATCELDCGRGASRLQLCKTDAECAQGTCYVNRCAGGIIYHACAPIQGCSQ